MGRHEPRRFPDSWGHKHRFVIAFAGIIALAFVALTIVALLNPS